MTPTPIVVPLASPGTPVTFQLQGTGELELKSVQATIDGSAAASAFYPVLSIYTQDDKLISRTRTADTVAAAGSAVVTWAPFLRKQAAAAAGSGITTAFRVSNLSNQTCVAGASTDLTWNTTVSSIGSPFTTADSKTFVLALGYWQIGFQCDCHAQAPQAATGPSAVKLNDTGGVDLFNTTIFWSDGNHGTADKIGVVGVQTLDGRASAIHLISSLSNFTGADLLVLSGTEQSYLWGNLLIGP